MVILVDLPSPQGRAPVLITLGDIKHGAVVDGLQITELAGALILLLDVKRTQVRGSGAQEGCGVRVTLPGGRSLFAFILNFFDLKYLFFVYQGLLLDTYLVVVQELKAHKIVSRKSQPLTVMVNELSLE